MTIELARRDGHDRPGRAGPDAPAGDLRLDMPGAARVYDRLLGGKDHFAADVAVVDAVSARFPSLFVAARAARSFGLAVTESLARQGVTQFLDIGAGYPADTNLHEVAQALTPDARVVYVDNDPLVAAHARALLVGSTPHHVAVVEADVRDPEAILSAATLRATLDLARPVALSLNSVMHYVATADAPFRAVATLVDALAPGSYLVMSHLTEAFSDLVADAVAVYRGFGLELVARGYEDFAEFFDEVTLVGPGITALTDWLDFLGEYAIGPGDVSLPRIGARLDCSRVPFLAAVGRVDE